METKSTLKGQDYHPLPAFNKLRLTPGAQRPVSKAGQGIWPAGGNIIDEYVSG